MHTTRSSASPLWYIPGAMSSGINTTVSAGLSENTMKTAMPYRRMTIIITRTQKRNKRICGI